jgi:hypothetical protein
MLCTPNRSCVVGQKGMCLCVCTYCNCAVSMHVRHASSIALAKTPGKGTVVCFDIVMQMSCGGLTYMYLELVHCMALWRKPSFPYLATDERISIHTLP